MLARRALETFAVILALAACSRVPKPGAPDTGVAPAPPPPPPPPPAPVADAAADGADARLDAGDGPVAPPSRPRAAAAPRPPAPVSGGKGISGVSATGGLSQAEAAKVLRAGAGALRACYDGERAKNPALRGRATFRLTVDRRGRVTFGEVVTSTLGGGGTEMCMARATRSFKFPARTEDADATVSFQMGFSP